MGMGIVSDEEFEKVVNNTNRPVAPAPFQAPSLPTATIKEKAPLGRGTGNVEVPNALRKVIGETHAVDGRDEGVALAKEFGLSPQSSDAYAKGATSLATFNEPKTDNKSHVDTAKVRAANRARKKMMSAIHHISEDKLQQASAKELSSVAKDMAAVVKAMEPEHNNGHGGGNGPTFVFYAPRLVNEEKFEVIQVNE